MTQLRLALTLRSESSGRHVVPQRAELRPRQLDDRPGPDGLLRRSRRGDDVAGQEARVLLRMVEERLPVDAVPSNSSGVTTSGPSEIAKSCAFAPVQLRRDPVVHQREAADRAGADHRREAQLRLDLPRRRAGSGIVSLGAVDRGRVRERRSRRRRRSGSTADAARARGSTTSSSAILGVLARGAAAGEERLQRLRGELDDPVAFDPARPAALRSRSLRREHAELHSRGSVCTTTSAISGRSRRIASSISARLRVRVGERRAAAEPSVRYATSPSSVCTKRSSSGSAPVASRTIARRRGRGRSRRRRPRPRPAASSASGSRCVCTAVDLGHRLADRALDLLGDLVRLLERAGRPAASGAATARCPSRPTTALTLCTSRTRGTPSAAACARSRTSASLSIGSTWTTTSASGSADCTRPLDRVGRRMPLADGGVVGDADHDVGEIRGRRPGACAAGGARRQARCRRSRARAASSASAGTRSIRTSMLPRIRRTAATSTMHATKSAAIESAS